MVNQTPYFLAILFWILSFIFCVIGYGTGYWYEAEGEGRLFKRLGLWETCFDGYEHTSDYIGKAYYGCWWIFHKEYSYIRDWILPPWFVGVQTLMTFALCGGFLGLGLIPMAGKESESSRPQILASVVAGFTTICLGISVVTFGIMVGEDRTWMPRPDIDRMSWSFGCVVVAGFLAAFSCISITVYTLMRQYEKLSDEYDGGPNKMASLKPNRGYGYQPGDIPMKPVI